MVRFRLEIAVFDLLINCGKGDELREKAVSCGRDTLGCRFGEGENGGKGTGQRGKWLDSKRRTGEEEKRNRETRVDHQGSSSNCVHE